MIHITLLKLHLRSLFTMGKSQRKTNQLSVRLDDQLLDDVEECAKITGLDPAVFMREAFKAFVAEVREKGEIRLPLAIVPKAKAAPHAAPATVAGIVHPRTGSTAALRLEGDASAMSLNESRSPAPTKYPKRKPTKS